MKLSEAHGCLSTWLPKTHGYGSLEHILSVTCSRSRHIAICSTRLFQALSCLKHAAVRFTWLFKALDWLKHIALWRAWLTETHAVVVTYDCIQLMAAYAHSRRETCMFTECIRLKHMAVWSMRLSAKSCLNFTVHLNMYLFKARDHERRDCLITWRSLNMVFLNSVCLTNFTAEIWWVAELKPKKLQGKIYYLKIQLAHETDRQAKKRASKEADSQAFVQRVLLCQEKWCRWQYWEIREPRSL